MSLFASENNHENHKAIERGIPKSLRTEIISIYESGITKPNLIISECRKRKIIEPNKSQLRNYLYSYNNKKNGKARIDSIYLNNWCKENSIVPDSDDKMFIVDYKLQLNSPDPKQQKIDIFFSTKRLLSFTDKSNMVQIDATYKLVWESFPIFVIGCSDQNRVFHPFGISVSGGESHHEFGFVFSAIKKYNTNWTPLYLLSDCADAIELGFRNIIGEPVKRLLCFVHVLKNIKDSIPKSENKNTIIADIKLISTSYDDNMFYQSVKLFVLKWREVNDPYINKFLTYFEDYYVKRHPFWFYGAASGIPTTNNGIEGTNSVIKSQHTFRERWPLKKFLTGLNSLVENWSYYRNPACPNYKEFCQIYVPSTKEWTSAFNWLLDSPTIIEKICESSSDYYFLSKKLTKEESLKQIELYMSNMKEWDDFEKFKSFRIGLVIVTEYFFLPGIFYCNCENF